MGKFLKTITITALLIAAFFIKKDVYAHGYEAPPIPSWYNNEIINDGEFIYSTSMSIADIQNFLNTRGPAACDTWGTKLIYDSRNGDTITRRLYAERRGQSAPFTCLKSYSQGGKTSAQIIYETARAYNINPRVILTTLEKEQSLITDDWPWKWNYDRAMGMACPESGGCDAATLGFTTQVQSGSRLLKAVYNKSCSPSSGPFYEFKYFNTFAGQYRVLDTVNTYVSNCATAALYQYTPHRPDSAWMDRGSLPHYYGNYNFVTLYAKWFQSYSYKYVTARQPAKTLFPGQESEATLTLKNTGTAPWYADGPGQRYPMRLNVISGSEMMGSSGWLDSRRIAMETLVVNPGENAVFRFKVKMPSGGGLHIIRFAPIVENLPSQPGLRDMGMQFNIFNPKGDLYRFWSGVYKTHFYTASVPERGNLLRYPSVWKYEGVVGKVYLSPINGSVPVYRFYSSKLGRHFYTASWVERESLVRNSTSWKLEGVAYYAFNTAGAGKMPFYRFWSPVYSSHFYTSSESQKNALINTASHFWRFEGIGYYIPTP